MCGFRLRDELPATYPHVLAFPLAMELMASPASRSRRSASSTSPTGSSSAARCGADERLDLRVRAENLGRPRARHAVRLVGEATVDGEVVWRGRQPVPAPRRRRRSSAPRETGPSRRPRARSGRVPGDIGRRYARVLRRRATRSTCTRSPRRRSASRARSRTACGRRRAAWPRSKVTCRTPTPPTCASSSRIRIPGRVAFSFSDGDFAVHDARSGKPHLSGRVS